MNESLIALLLLKVLPDNPQIETNLPPFVREEAYPLNEMGYLRPPLIESSDARAIEVRPFAEGALEHVIQRDGRHLICVGWATLPRRAKAADFVFLTCDNQNGEPVIIAGADMGAEWPGVIRSFGDANYSWAGWIATISLDKLPPATKTLRLTAWALDTRTGKACRLGEPIILAR